MREGRLELVGPDRRPVAVDIPGLEADPVAGSPDPATGTAVVGADIAAVGVGVEDRRLMRPGHNSRQRRSDRQ